MSRTLAEIEKEVMELSTEDRETLAHILLGDMQSIDPETEKAWLEEADRRLDEMLDGTVKGIPADEVFAQVRKAVDDQRNLPSSRPE